MHGFSAILNRCQYNFISEGNTNPTVSNAQLLCYNNMIKKFSQDRVFYSDEDIVFVFDGIVLNKSFLLKKNNNWCDFLVSEYKKCGVEFIKTLRGSFCGLIYDKKINRYYLYTDQIGSRFLYYTIIGKTLFVSSQIGECYAFLNQNKIHYSLNRDNAYILLTYGFMLEERTLCDKIFKIEPGCYMSFEEGKTKITQYCIIENAQDFSISEEDAIEIMDEEFRRVIKMEFDKDCEYGYNHIVALSGGLDSRMVTWVAHDMGYTRQINMTFSHSGYLDQTLAQQIASDLGHEWIFKSLDGGWWLMDVDEITKMTGGNVLYLGQAHGNSINKLIDFTTVGISHSGQVGDVAFSCPYGLKGLEPYLLGEGAYSSIYLDRIKESVKLHAPYPNREIAQLYYRSFSGNYYSGNNKYSRTEVFSPFQDFDLINRMFKIPIHIRENYNLYFKWILKKYPDAANYIWEKRGCRIDRKFGIINYKGHEFTIEAIPGKIINRLKGISSIDTPKSMNPVGFYIKNNPVLQKWIDNYFIENIDRIKDEQMHKDIQMIYQGNNSIQKIQAISLLSAIKIFF